MKTTKGNNTAKRLFDKQNRKNTLLGIAGGMSLTLGVILFVFGLWTHFHSESTPLVAACEEEKYAATSNDEGSQAPEDGERLAYSASSKDNPNSISFTTNGFSDFAFISLTSEGAIDLNDLGDGEVGLTFQYKDESGTWQNVPDGKNIFDYYNSGISITFKFNKEFTQEELQQSEGTFTYDLPPYLKDFGADQGGKLYDQNGKEAGTVTVDANGKVTIQLNEEFRKNNNSAKDLRFTLSGKVDLEKATEKEVGDKNYPGFELEIPKDEREAHSQYGTLELQKKCISTVPQRDETTGEWYLDYELTVTAPDFDMPDVHVEDIFDLTSDNASVKERLKDLIDAYVKYSVGDDSLNSDVKILGAEEEPPKTSNSVYQTTKDGVPQLNWYLGDMTAGESRTLHYRVRLNQAKMKTTNFTKDGTNLPNRANAFSQTYPKDNAEAELPIKMHVNVHKENQGKFESDGQGGGWLTYEVWVQNDSEYPVDVKIYDSVNDPHANTTNNDKSDKGKGLTYEKESFQFKDSKDNPLDPQPELDLSVKGENDAGYTSFTAHIGWMEPGEKVSVTYKIHVDAETLAAGTVDVNNGVLALFEGQETTNNTYPTWLERYQQNHTIDQEQWAAKNFGGKVDPGEVALSDADTVYDATGESVTIMENHPDSFELGENSFQYTVTVNGNTVWDVSSATMGDHLTNGLQYSGYVQVVAKNKDGQILKTVWVKVDKLKEFSFTGDDIGFGDYGAGTSYKLTYYTTIDEDNINSQVVLGNEFSMQGTIYGPDGKVIQVSVQDSTSNTAETSNHLKVTKDAWYYEPDAATNLGAFYWVVKVDASYIPNGFALKDVAGEKHELREGSLLGVYTGPEHEFSSESDWAAFQDSADTIGFKEFKQYKSQFAEGTGLTVIFGEEDYTPKDEAPYVYLFFKTYVTERQTNPYENVIYSNSDNIHDTEVDYREDDATSYLPGVGDVEKAGMQVFDWDGSKITFLNNANSSADYKLDENILSDGSVPAGRYAAWSVSVNKTGSMEGDFTITDQIPAGMELSFVAIAKTMHIMQEHTANTPPWALVLSSKGEGKSGLLVGHAKTHGNAYTTGGPYRINWSESAEWKPWTAENWKYYPSTDGRMVSWGVHIEDSMCISSQTNKSLGAYEVDYLVVCRVTDPDVLLGVTRGDPQKIFNNHVTVYDQDGNIIDNADAQLTVPCKPIVTKEGIQDVVDGHRQQTIKFMLKVNEEATTVEGEENLVLKDTMSENLILVKDSVKFYSDPACTEELEAGVSFTSVGNVITFTIPNGKAVYIQYECMINAPEGSEEKPVENTINFEGRKPDDQGGTWNNKVHYDSTGGISGSKTMQITKKDSLTGKNLPGAEFEVTLLGTTNDQGEFVKSEVEPDKFKLTTGDNGVSNAFTPTEGGLYQIEETKAPDGYVPDGTPRYYWVGKGTFAPPTAEAAGLTGEPAPKINAMYTGVIDVEITNERAKITMTKKFVNAEGGELSSEIAGTYTFGLFTKDDDGNYQAAEAAYGARVQSLIYPEEKDKVLTFYVPYGTGQQYYILELDTSGNPMEPGSRFWVQAETLGMAQFEPSYEYSNGKANSGEVSSNELPRSNDCASSQDTETTVTVTNTFYASYSLPETGGPGTLFYLLTGLALIVGGGAVMLFAKRRLHRAQ